METLAKLSHASSTPRPPAQDYRSAAAIQARVKGNCSRMLAQEQRTAATTTSQPAAASRACCARRSPRSARAPPARALLELPRRPHASRPCRWYRNNRAAQEARRWRKAEARRARGDGDPEGAASDVDGGRVHRQDDDRPRRRRARPRHLPHRARPRLRWRVAPRRRQGAGGGRRRARRRRAARRQRLRGRGNTTSRTAAACAAPTAPRAGEWRHGRLHGRATASAVDARTGLLRVHGQWREGLRHGRGVARDPDGRRRRVRDDAPHGAGEHRLSGERYVGEWIGGARHGKGTFFSALGHKYEGDWVGGALLDGRCTAVARRNHTIRRAAGARQGAVGGRPGADVRGAVEGRPLRREGHVRDAGDDVRGRLQGRQARGPRLPRLRQRRPLRGAVQGERVPRPRHARPWQRRVIPRPVRAREAPRLRELHGDLERPVLGRRVVERRPPRQGGAARPGGLGLRRSVAERRQARRGAVGGRAHRHDLRRAIARGVRCGTGAWVGAHGDAYRGEVLDGLFDGVTHAAVASTSLGETGTGVPPGVAVPAGDGA